VGNIGVGKSTLCNKLARKYTKCHFIEEEVVDNPHLEPFYEYLDKGAKGPNPHAFPL
jgi:deoxyadenosine/deoxycytidine kinase